MRWLGWGALAAGIAIAGPAFAQTAAQHASAAATALPFDPDQATRAWLNTMDPAAVRRSNSYFEGGYWMQFVGPIIGFVVAYLFLQLGLAKGLRAGLEKSVRFYLLVALVFAFVYSLVGAVAQFPWDWWTGFVREHAYNLSTQNFGQWFGEYLLRNAIGLVIGSVAFAILYLIIAATKRSWWIWGTIATLAFVMIQQFAFPVFIAPKFNTYTAMPDSPLKQSVLQLAQANGVPVDNVYVFDLSRQTHGISANVSGLFGTTRISLSDNLINRENPGGVRAVLGHEMGHYVLDQSWSLLAMFALMIASVFAISNILFNRLSAGERWGVRNVWDPAGMPLLFSIVGLLFLLATPIQNNITRFHEHQADMFGLNAAREPDGFAESAILLSEYRKMEPSPLEEWFFYDHPSGYDRIHMAMVWKAHHMALGDIPISAGGPPPGWRPDFVVMHQGQAGAARAPISAPSPGAASNSPARP
jgi:STE24 endopeptidase